jgi:hypothetical protein
MDLEHFGNLDPDSHQGKKPDSDPHKKAGSNHLSTRQTDLLLSSLKGTLQRDWNDLKVFGGLGFFKVTPSSFIFNVLQLKEYIRNTRCTDSAYRTLNMLLAQKPHWFLQCCVLDP